jgi:hypothetical protein
MGLPTRGSRVKPNGGTRTAHRRFAWVGAGAVAVALGLLVVALGLSSAAPGSTAKSTEFPVTFSESGLAAGTNWSISIGGQTHFSTGLWINVSEPDGTYLYTVGSVAGYTVAPEGNVTVNGAAVQVPIAFSPSVTEYTVTFTQVGLPAGLVWSVTLNGLEKSTNSSSAIVFTEPNGNYTFSVGHVPGYRAHPTSGRVLVNGGDVLKHVHFKHRA